MALSTDFGIIVPPAAPEESIEKFWDFISEYQAKKEALEDAQQAIKDAIADCK